MYPLQYPSGKCDVKSSKTGQLNLCVPHKFSNTHTITRIMKETNATIWYEP